MRYSMLCTVKMCKNTFMCLVNNDRRRKQKCRNYIQIEIEIFGPSVSWGVT